MVLFHSVIGQLFRDIIYRDINFIVILDLPFYRIKHASFSPHIPLYS